MNNGSTWRRWNFHVHTKGTNKNDNFTSSTMDDFFCKFYKEAYKNQISAIGITDYFSIDRYLEAVEYRKEIGSKTNSSGGQLFKDEEIAYINKLFIFPNVELRMLPATDKGRLINIHCLFNPDYVSYLENDFFGHISNQDGEKMNRRGMINYGKSLDASISGEQQQYLKGLENFVIDLKSLKEVVSNNKNFKTNTLLVVSNSSNDGASAIQKHYDLFESENGSLDGLRKSIYCISDAIFSGNPKDVKYFLGRKSIDTEGYNDSIYLQESQEVIRERGSLKPCIVGCDAHTEEDLFKKFSWIKADLHFEGLRQICFEPEQRVKNQKDCPDFKEEKLLIKSAKFISPTNIFSGNSIHLNPNLNVIIGGKSSGKSILLYAIAKTLSADASVLKNDDNSYKYDLDKIEQGLDFEITTVGGFNQRLNRSTDDNSILPEIKYIPQNYLVKLAEPELNKKGQSLNKIIRELITEDEMSKELYDEFVSKVIQNDKLRNGQIDIYFETQKEISSLENELKTKSNKSVLEKNIESNLKKIEELNKETGLTEEQIKEFEGLQSKLENGNMQLQNLRDDLSSIQTFNTELNTVIKNLVQKKNSVLVSLKHEEIRTTYDNEYSFIDTLAEAFNRIESTLRLGTNSEGKSSFVNDNKFKEISIRLNTEQKELNKQIEPYLKDEEIKKVIEELNHSVSTDRKSLTDLDSLANKITEKKKILDETKGAIFEIYENSYQEYINVINGLKIRTEELQKDGLTIEGKAQFNFSKLRKDLIPVSDGRTASYNSYTILSESRKATDETEFREIITDVKKLFDDIISKQYTLTNKRSIPDTIKLVLDDYFFDYWQITYKNDKLGKMSTGKASFVILMLIIGLSKSKAPILIDQPEDNLDNRSITTDLVNYLRNKKLERQIIIVTHNANIVVNADAENIVVANQKGQSNENSSSPFKFDYVNGSIENSFEKILTETDILKSMGIRQHVADVVEGGKEAFILREKKYGFYKV